MQRTEGLSATARRRGEPLPLPASVLRSVIDWIRAIPFEAWPQQHRLADGQIRPAMVTDLGWYGFGAATDELVRAAMPSGTQLRERNRLLSVVMPGAVIDPHTDELGPDWVTRVHVPITTNPDAMFITGDRVLRLAVGCPHEINTRERHAVWNAGPSPRVHLMFDLHEAF